MNRSQLAHQVSITLADHLADFNVAAILDEIQDTYGLVDIDTIDSAAYWALVERHDGGDEQPRVLRSDTEPADVPADQADELTTAIAAGRALRETYYEEDGQPVYAIRLRSYATPDGGTSYAVLYDTPGVSHWCDVTGAVRGHALYEQAVRDETAGAASSPIWTVCDVDGIPVLR